MAQDAWKAVDGYIAERLLSDDAILDGVLAANEAAGLPAIDVSPTQGKLLHLIARMGGARRILEIGTLGGYSTIWLARALPPGGIVVTLEADPYHARVARANFVASGLSDRIDLRLGAALDTLPQIEAENGGPFDLVFMDADKESNAEYLAWALKLSRPGTVVIADNVVRDGGVLQAASDDPMVLGTRALFDAFAAAPRLSATAIQTVGMKGWDGFAIALVE